MLPFGFEERTEADRVVEDPLMLTPGIELEGRRPKIAFTVADMGSAECLVPVISALWNSADALVFVDSNPKSMGRKLLQSTGIDFADVENIDAQAFDLVVCGTSGKVQDLQRSATLSAQKAGVPVVWCQDFYLTGCERNMLDVSPDWFLVLDEDSRSLTLRARKDYPEDRVVAVGQADFDRIPELIKNREELKRMVRNGLGLNPWERLVLFAASSINAGSQVDMMQSLHFLESACYTDGKLSVIATFHPADWNDPALERYLKEAKKFCHPASLQRESLPDQLTLVAASDAVVVQFSTIGIKASLMVPTMFLMLPSLQKNQRNRGAKWPFFPQVQHRLAEGGVDR